MRTVALFILAPLWAVAAEVPQAFLSVDEAEPIHSAIIRKETWTLDPVRHLRAEAEKRLHEGPWTVTSDRPTDLQLDLQHHRLSGGLARRTDNSIRRDSPPTRPR